MESNVKILWMLDGERVIPNDLSQNNNNTSIKNHNLIASDIPEIMVFTAKPLMKEIVDELIDKAVNCVKCDICDKLFAYKQSLSVHMKAFHDNMPKCDMCKKSFSSKFNLNKHVRVVHGVVGEVKPVHRTTLLRRGEKQLN